MTARRGTSARCAIGSCIVAVVAACAPTERPPIVVDAAVADAWTCTDLSDDAWRACGGDSFGGAPTCSPDGEGYCCPLAAPSCACVPLGGFAADPCACVYQRVCDMHPSKWRTEVDEHGCLVARGGPGPVHCF